MRRTFYGAFRAFHHTIRPTWRFVGRLGFGRQGALAATRRIMPAGAQTQLQRAASLFMGSLLIGVGVALLQQADLGLSPYDVLVSGLGHHLPLSFGQIVWLVSAVLFAVAALLREFPSAWGLAYVLANGIAIDAVAGFINSPTSLLARLLFVVLALVSISAGIALVVHSGSTGGSFELLMRAGEKRGRSRRSVRMMLEVSVFATGVALGGSFGIATVLIALAIGPMLGLIAQALEDHRCGREVRQLATRPEQRHPSIVGAR